ncbi:MAG: hypothetical protein GVY13_10290 [Alphaproteobacteria bacterium]|nr:hypothetical protein [Alphaproteobacteria bacterium]
MLFYLLPAEELVAQLERLGYAFQADAIPRTVEYYLARTAHGSTLSRLVHAWVLARSNRAAAWRLFCEALDSDVSDIQGGTTQEGIHLGAMAGTVDLLQRCFTGIDTQANALSFNPMLPQELTGLKATIRYRQHLLDVAIDQESLRIASRPAAIDTITILYRGQARQLAPGGHIAFRLIDGRGRPGARGA